MEYEAKYITLLHKVFTIAARSLPTSCPLLYSVAIFFLILFVDYWSVELHICIGPKLMNPPTILPSRTLPYGTVIPKKQLNI